MENNILHTRHGQERVSSTYAEIYFDDSFCDEIKIRELTSKAKSPEYDETQRNDEWTSPSDLLIGTVELKPPFTSKITRGKTHEGILIVGDNILEIEQTKFLQQLNTLIHENDAAWKHILEHEKAFVSAKVKEVYKNIFQNKSKIMTAEIASFYENSLQEIEGHLRSEVQNVLTNVHARIISNLNVQIKEKMEKERNILEKTLKTRYNAEEMKVKTYYKLLFQNELHRNNMLVHNAISERNEALKAFFQQLEMENITNTMYVMCTERKKCKIKKITLENYQDTEIVANLEKVKDREMIIESYKKNEVRITDINKEWEDKIKNILKIFLKFISFSLKLLPEQATFLMDFEKMVVLQLNEIIQKPLETQSMLLVKENLDNTFKFDHLESNVSFCKNEPIVITGNMEDPTPLWHGSRETLDSDVDLPTIRLQRQFIYAKCHQYEEIKKLLDKNRCKCRDVPLKESSNISIDSVSPESVRPSTSYVSESSNELLLVNDINRLYECPIRKCKDWAKRYSFPYLESYLDFTEENLQRVQNILGNPPNKVIMPELLDPRDIILHELPFAATKERFHTVETQYSSPENSHTPSIVCPCIDDMGISGGKKEPSALLKEPKNKDLNKILMQRKNTIKELLYNNTELLNFFTDESFDFVI